MNPSAPLHTLLALFAVSGLQAAALVTYIPEGTGAAPAPDRSPTAVISGISASQFTTSISDAGVTYPTSDAGGWRLRDDGEADFLPASATQADWESEAVLDADFHEFTLTADTGNLIDLQTFSFRLRAGSTSGVRSLFVRSSEDAYATTLFNTGDVNSTSYAPFSFSLAGLTDTTSITFRIYTYATNDAGTQGQAGRGVFFSNMTLDGSIGVIPEPSPSLFLLSGLLATAVVWPRQRRMRRLC